MNKKISFSIAVIIIVVLAVLVGGVAVWQYLRILEENSFPVTEIKRGVTLEDIKNNTYAFHYGPGTLEELKDGTIQFSENSAFFPFPGGIYKFAFGDLNGDNFQDAAVILWEYLNGDLLYYLTPVIYEKGKTSIRDDLRVDLGYNLTYLCKNDIFIKDLEIRDEKIIFSVITPSWNSECSSWDKVFKRRLWDNDDIAISGKLMDWEISDRK